MRKNFVSVCIPVEKKTPNLEQALQCLAKQTYKQFEVIVASSQALKSPYTFVQVHSDKKLAGKVAVKRNQILRFGKGDLFVFNDDDVFTPPNYLGNIVLLFADKEILVAGGPLLLPLAISLQQKATKAVWESYVGMGGLGGGMHLTHKMSSRTVYDHPAANLIVRREVFQQIGGFQPGLYPGEDTKLCLDILNLYKKGVQYHPELYVYHLRKPLFREHLNQIGRYGAQRGLFALTYPETSLKLLYLIPSFFLLYLISLPSLLLIHFIFFLPFLLYVLLLLLQGLALLAQNGLSTSVVAVVGIVVTHFYYGYKFLLSFTGKLWSKLLQLVQLLRKI